MSIIDKLVTDRALSDVERWKTLRGKGWAGMTADEQTEWTAGMKGAYNAADLNRVNEAMDYLHKSLTGYGYTTGYVPQGIVWAAGDIPTVAQLEAYRKNVEALRSTLDVRFSTPEAPADMAGLTWQEANDIEQILIDIETVIQRVVKAFYRTNAYTFRSGALPLPAAESYMGRTWAELDAMSATWRNWQAADWYLLLYGNLEAEGDVA